MYEIIPEFKHQRKALASARRKARLQTAFTLFCFFILIAVGARFLWIDWQLDQQASMVLSIPEPNKQAPSTAPLQKTEAMSALRNPILFRKNILTKETGVKLEVRFRQAAPSSDIQGQIFFVQDSLLAPKTHFMAQLPAQPEHYASLRNQSYLPADFQGTASGSTVISSIQENQRPAPLQDVRFVDVMPGVVRLSLINLGIAEDEAAEIFNLIKAQAPEMDQPVNLAVRLEKKALRASVRQFAIHSKNEVPKSFFLNLENGTAEFTPSENPWPDFALTREDDQNSGQEQTSYRLIDGIYSAGLRAELPTEVISETIYHLSRAYDISSFVSPDDKITLLYSDAAREPYVTTGKVLFIHIDRGYEALTCYILKPERTGDYVCITENDNILDLASVYGFVPPVQGALSSSFGPRLHPILKVVRPHNGVDWAAPTGTPVLAALDGRVSFLGDTGGYGNMVRITHSDNRETRYAHLHGFAAGLKVGQEVKSGSLIGYVGTTGLSTGPHLHFELLQNGVPIDPFSYQSAMSALGGNIGKLVQRIIQIESGGNPYAKNPTSSATGLGQFIDSTWIRMMHAHRPDLVESFNREELLALKTDPTLATEMVKHYAKENEATLRRAGLSATPGQLYLAHFLGSGGAINVLLSPEITPLEDILGYGVINANNFLAGKDAAWIEAWADRKMANVTGFENSSLPQNQALRVKSKRFRAYKSAIDDMVGKIETHLAPNRSDLTSG